MKPCCPTRRSKAQSPAELTLGTPAKLALRAAHATPAFALMIEPLVVLAMVTVLSAGGMQASDPLNTPAIRIAGRGLYHTGTSTNAPAIYNFTWIEQGPSRWFMTLMPATGVGDRFEVEYAGKEIRTLVQRVSGGGILSYYANLLPGPEPIQFTQPLVATIWLAYSRAAKEQFAGSGVATCPFSESGEVRKLRYESQREDKELAFRKITFYDDGVDAISRQPRRTPFEKGYKQFVFEANQVVVTNGAGVSRASRMIEFLPKSDAASSEDVVARRSCELIAEEISFGAFPAVHARLPGDQSIPVADARLGNFRKAIFYTFTNEWPTMAQLEATPEYMEWRAKNRDLVYSGWPRATRAAFIAALVVLSSIALFLSRERLFSKR